MTKPPPGGTARRALICGIGGQDGAYLAEPLLALGYRVVGTSRDAAVMNRAGLRQLKIAGDMRIVSMAANDFRSVLQTLSRVRPDEVYNLAGQTSVGLLVDQPVEAIESITMGTLNLLEAIRFSGQQIRLCNAGSSECFGDTGTEPATEETPFRPRSPYAVAKVCAHNLISSYREAYGIRACTAILFNHESPLRPGRFVTQKIVLAAARIAASAQRTLELGDLDIHRDWGWAPDYVRAMWLMLQAEEPEDYIIATGRTVSLRYFAEQAFGHFGLGARDQITFNSALQRSLDIRFSAAKASNAHTGLGWKAGKQVDAVIEAMCLAAAATVRTAEPSLRQVA